MSMEKEILEQVDFAVIRRSLRQDGNLLYRFRYPI
jgi:hypothetical protein